MTVTTLMEVLIRIYISISSLIHLMVIMYAGAPTDGFAALWRRDFPLMKNMGANTLRMYP